MLAMSSGEDDEPEQGFNMSSLDDEVLPGSSASVPPEDTEIDGADLLNFNALCEEELTWCFSSWMSAKVDVDLHYACPLCPFRSFTRKRGLLHHYAYHKAPHFVAAAASARASTNAGRLSQLKLAQAIYRHRSLASAIKPVDMQCDLLRKSAQLIRSWNEGVVASERNALARSNQCPLVKLWTASGPKLVLRSMTVDTTRITQRTYYSNDFENLVIATALVHRGHVKSMLDSMLSRWAESTLSGVMLAAQSHTVLRECVSHIFTKQGGKVTSAIDSLKSRATARGEWVAICHDATFKCLFSIIGQVKMAQ